MEAGEENPDRFLEAVMSGDVPKVCEMINAGADVNLPVNQVGHKPTHHAAMAGDPDMLDALVSAGGDVNDVGELSGSVLQFACQHYEFVPEAALKMVTTLTRDNKIHHRTVLGSALAYASALGMVLWHLTGSLEETPHRANPSVNLETCTPFPHERLVHCNTFTARNSPLQSV
eukprot:m.128944 g.128944  ORF g.128944 m.128944 type:complete len:173 (-) comp17450_c0_seq17:805-1323(-)